MGIKPDYIQDVNDYEAYYDDHYNKNEERIRYSQRSGVGCSHNSGVMSDLDTARRIVRWTPCSFEDFQLHIRKNGGQQNFCLYLKTRLAKIAIQGYRKIANPGG